MPLPKSRGSLFQALDLSGFPHGRSEAKTNDLFLLAPPESGHQQNASSNSRITQRNRFVERSHALPLCPFFFERPHALDRATATPTRPHDPTIRPIAAHIALHHSKSEATRA